MKKKKIKRKMLETWRELLSANAQKDDWEAGCLQQKMIKLEIKLKNKRALSKKPSVKF
jgi:hypothetical protein